MTKLSSIDLTFAAKYNIDNINIWPESQVANWIKDIGFEPYSGKFEEHNITGEVICDLRHEHLKEMGIGNVGDRIRMLVILKRLEKPSKLVGGKKNKRLEQTAAISSSPGGLRVDTRLGSISSQSVGPSTKSSIPKHSQSGNNDTLSKSRNGTLTKKDTIARNEDSANSSDDQSRKRVVIRVLTEDEQSRIMDITDVTSLKHLYMRIFQKFSIARLDSDSDAQRAEREMEKWSLLYMDKKMEGKSVTAEDLAGWFKHASSNNDDGFPRFLLRRKGAGTERSKGRKKYAKLENFFGEKIAAKSPERKGMGNATPSPSATSALSAVSGDKLRSFFGDRPPSEMITGNLPKFFPSVVSDISTTPVKLSEKRPVDIVPALESRKEGVTTTPSPQTPATDTTNSPPKKQESPLRSADTIGEPKGVIRWAKGSLLGTGSFGSVYMALNNATGEILAVKQVALPDTDEESPMSKVQNRRKQMVEALHREIALLKELEHPNIVRYLGSESTDHFLNIFLEYVAGGSIASALADYGVFEEALVGNYVKQILKGLNYLHDKNIVHRDIKGANILLDNKGTVKITDFGISKKLGDGKDRGSVISLYAGGAPQNRTSALQGSVFWMSPEVVKHYHYTKKSDIWSVGCVIVEMITGKHPWPELTQMQALYKIGSGELPVIPEPAKNQLRNFLEQCFIMNYKDRPTADILLKHEFVSEDEK